MTEDNRAATLPTRRTGARIAWIAGALAVLALIIWQGVTAAGNPDPLTVHGSTVASIDIAVLVFREGLECILVISAITASMVGDSKSYRRPIAAGATVLEVDGRPLFALPGAFAFYRDLSLGMNGPDVSQLQAGLRAAGLDVGVDGSFGASTERAVRLLYERNGYAASAGTTQGPSATSPTSSTATVSAR